MDKKTRIGIWAHTMYYFFSSIVANKEAQFLSPEETVDYAIKNKKSIIRFGDGEFNIIGGKGIHYQNRNRELSDNLNNVINEYIDNRNSVNYLVCMPSDFLKRNGLLLLKKKVYISSWSYSRYVFKKFYDKSAVYGDAFVFAKEYEDIYKKIWENEKVEEVIFIHNDETYFNYFSEKYKMKSTFIKVPSKNAYDEKKTILEEILVTARNMKNYVVLISAGPTAKYLAYELSRKDIIAIDTGHCWDNPLKVY